MKNSPLFNVVWWLVIAALLALFILPASGPMLGSMAFWLMMVFGFFVLLGLMGSTSDETSKDDAAPASDEAVFTDPFLDGVVREVLTVNGKKVRDGVVQYEGRLIQESDKAYARLNASLGAFNRKIILQDAGGGETRVLVFPAGLVATATPTRTRPILNLALFVLTLGTTTWAGALHQGVNLLQEPGRFAVGLPYSLALLLILGAHELGHYFAARHHGMNVSLPYFIPVPFGLGTFGAFIRLRALAPDRKSLFDMAVAGPLAGFVFAVPALIIGMGLSQIVPMSTATGLFGSRLDIGSSLLLTLLAKLSIGGAMTEGHTLLLHPLAYAGWLGLLVTALNLLPIGQLDGGHIAHAVFGPVGAHRVSILASGALLALALFVWPGLLFFAVLVLLFAGTRDAPSADDATALNPGRKWLGYATFVILLLILLPVPHKLFPAFGIHCPYL
jgi:membrane-associated protease RseP (regulator of RpoE activity)